MVKYTIKDVNGGQNIVLIDEQFDIRILVAVVFDRAHARIILRLLNQYGSKKIEE